MKAPFDFEKAREVADLIVEEMWRQHQKWGEQNHPDLDPNPTKLEDPNYPDDIDDREIQVLHARELEIPTAYGARYNCERAVANKTLNWGVILIEEVAEAIEQGALKNEAELKKELVQCAAVCSSWIQSINRRKK